MDFLAIGTTITKTYCASLLLKLREAIKSHRSCMINKVVQILQENTPVPNSHVTQMEVGSCVEKIFPFYSNLAT